MAGNDDTKERLCRSARKAFAKNGYLNTSLRDIADGAGLTTGAVYSQFRGKADLLAQVLRDADVLLPVEETTSANELAARRRAAGLLLSVAAEAAVSADLRPTLIDVLQRHETLLADVEFDGERSRVLLAIAVGELVLSAAGLTLPANWEQKVT